MMIEAITSRICPIQGAVSSMQGGRPENQDDWGIYDTPLGCLLIVCDGMGGGPGGKTASYIVKNEVAATLQGCNPQTPRIDALKMAVSRADDALYQKMDEMPSLRGMGSTMVAILVSPQSIVVAHLGDSRCYRISKGHVVFRTDDHSLVGELVRNKVMTEEQARVSPQSNVITRALGNTNNHVPELTEIAYRKGDRFILCTDGVWGVMPHEQLVQRLTSQQDIQALVSNLSAEIDQLGFAGSGKHDNHTIIAIEIGTDSILKDMMSKKLKIIMGIIAALLVVSVIFNITCMLKLNALSDIEEQENRKQKVMGNLVLDVKDDNIKELQTKVVILQEEKMLLEGSQSELIAKVDSLKNIIDSLQKVVVSSKQNEEKTAPVSTSGTKGKSQNLSKKVESIKKQR